MKFFAQTKSALFLSAIIILISACSGGSDSGSDIDNELPVSVISQTQGKLGLVLLLDGSSSKQASGDKTLTYTWSFLSVPENSQAVIDNANRPIARFIPDLLGNYVVQLIVNDGTTDSSPTTYTFEIVPNRPPVANPGSNKTINMGTTIQLDGSASEDPDGDPLVYRWRFTTRPANSNAAFNNTNIVNPSFFANLPGEYLAQLIVNDNQQVRSTGKTVTITVVTATQNTAPVAHAGATATVITNTQINLTGAGSVDANSDPLTYQWSMTGPVGSTAILNNATSVTPNFTPDLDGEYNIELIVNDGTLDSQPATAVITSQTPTTGNSPPIAIAGANAEIAINTPISLSGEKSSDAETAANLLSFQWRFVSVPPGSSALLIDEQTATPSFTPEIVGNYIVELIVNDGEINSNPNTVTITAKDPNTPPVADAGTIIEVNVADAGSVANEVINLDGSGSFDADSDELTYKWTFVLKPLDSTTTLNDTTITKPQFTPDKAGNYVAQLIVNDKKADSAPKTVVISINTIPIALAGNDITVNTNALVTLDGSGSNDPDGDDLSYKWAITGPGPQIPTLDNPNTATPSFTPIDAGKYTVELIVNDGKASSPVSIINIDANTVNTNTRPVAKAGTDFAAPLNSTVFLDGSNSSDPDSDTLLSYKWTITTAPKDSNATLENSTSAEPNFTPIIWGDYKIQLIVNDATDDSLPSTITVSTTVQCDSLKPDFLTTTWPVIEANCMGSGCHRVGGASTGLTFITDTTADTNFNLYKSFSTQKDGNNLPLILAKASNTVFHGGGEIFTATSAEYNTLAYMANRTATCVAANSGPADIHLNSRYEQLRKATLALTGLLPTSQEENDVKNAADSAVLDTVMDDILDVYLDKTQFYNRLMVIYNDLLLTNALRKARIEDDVDLSNFTNVDYFGDKNLTSAGYTANKDKRRLRRNATLGIERAPVELIANVVRKNQPFTNILTANYTMVNPYSATLFDLTMGGFEFKYLDPINNQNTFREAIIKDKNGRTYPHAGVLNTLSFLIRYPSSPTNLNRARSRVVYRFFLDTDVEGLADRAGLVLDDLGPRPTLLDPQCTVCHNVMDPIAGTFKNWDDLGPFLGNRLDWPDTLATPEMLPPGYSQVDLLDQPATALQWLAGRIIGDNAFAVSTVKTIFTAFIGKPPVDAEAAFIENLKTQFVSNNFNLKMLIKDVIKSTTFRANNLAQNENTALFADIGTGRLLTPEQLDSKIRTITGGYRWKSPAGTRLTNPDSYNILYGGINSSDVVTRITDPTAIMVGIQKRLAMQVSCDTVPADFISGATSRNYFPFVEMTDTPTSSSAKIEKNIQFLHKLILGEEFAIGDTELANSVSVFTSIWNNSTTGTTLPGECLGTLATNTSTKRTVHAWMGLVSYMLLDYKFLYE